MKSSQLKLTQNAAQAPPAKGVSVTCDAHFTFTTDQTQ